MDEYPNVQTTISFSEVLASQEINAVAIATPAESHFSMVKNSLGIKRRDVVKDSNWHFLSSMTLKRKTRQTG